MSVVIPAKDRVVFWAWVAWKDAGADPATKPPVVVAYLKAHYRIPILWWARYAVHVGTPIKPPQPPVFVPIALARHVQNIIFGAWEPLKALGSPAHFGVALSADPAYAQWATPATVAALRHEGHRVYAWGNQTQIGSPAIYKLQTDLGLDGAIFQSETEFELMAGLQAGAQLFVGNPNSWIPRIPMWNELVNTGKAVMSFETYTVDGAPWPEASGANGALVASECIGCYHGYEPSHYKAHTPVGIWSTICVYLAEGVTEGWGAL